MTEAKRTGDDVFSQLQKCLWILIARASDQAHGLVPYIQVEETKDAIEKVLTAIIEERDQAVKPKEFAQLSFEHDWKQNEFTDRLCDLIEDYDTIGWDYYDCSLEIYEVANDARLSEEAQRFIFDAGFGRIYLNHKNGFETHYSFGKEFVVTEGHHHKTNWHRTAENGNRRTEKERDAMKARVEMLEGAVISIRHPDQTCPFCGSWNRCIDDCIVRTIQSTKETH